MSKKSFAIRPLTLGDVESYLKRLRIKNFRGVFMRDMLPEKCNKTECGVINLDSIFSSGFHWCAYYRNENNALYFDSYGDVNPPKELVKYLNVSNLEYNTDRIQTYTDPPMCGHLCLEVLRRISNGENLKNIFGNINKYGFYKMV